ncbi:hypothetical protein EDEG_01576 [Edhazardia aedis USNM 41457]|uniref:Uncharacterized protein n=1 Tax=Edhazardia aedis (strain USNM 41457) TaxID=1003232 RepID=J9DNN0_EDHAE|nr:hypothetical protein EDEG_01576 [Edhazardia aedis USNM 41457]|eukprot:EJW04140.1 hypothetical protein EDEG_01576 [Edhazardia aedis USNM 41457]
MDEQIRDALYKISVNDYSYFEKLLSMNHPKFNVNEFKKMFPNVMDFLQKLEKTVDNSKKKDKEQCCKNAEIGDVKDPTVLLDAQLLNSLNKNVCNGDVPNEREDDYINSLGRGLDDSNYVNKVDNDSRCININASENIECTKGDGINANKVTMHEKTKLLLKEHAENIENERDGQEKNAVECTKSCNQAIETHRTSDQNQFQSFKDTQQDKIIENDRNSFTFTTYQLRRSYLTLLSFMNNAKYLLKEYTGVCTRLIGVGCDLELLRQGVNRNIVAFVCKMIKNNYTIDSREFMYPANMLVELAFRLAREEGNKEECRLGKEGQLDNKNEINVNILEQSVNGKDDKNHSDNASHEYKNVEGTGPDILKDTWFNVPLKLTQECVDVLNIIKDMINFSKTFPSRESTIKYLTLVSRLCLTRLDLKMYLNCVYKIVSISNAKEIELQALKRIVLYCKYLKTEDFGYLGKQKILSPDDCVFQIIKIKDKYNKEEEMKNKDVNPGEKNKKILVNNVDNDLENSNITSPQNNLENKKSIPESSKIFSTLITDENTEDVVFKLKELNFIDKLYRNKTESKEVLKKIIEGIDIKEDLNSKIPFNLELIQFLNVYNFDYEVTDLSRIIRSPEGVSNIDDNKNKTNENKININEININDDSNGEYDINNNYNHNFNGLPIDNIYVIVKSHNEKSFSAKLYALKRKNEMKQRKNIEKEKQKERELEHKKEKELKDAEQKKKEVVQKPKIAAKPIKKKDVKRRPIFIDRFKEKYAAFRVFVRCFYPAVLGTSKKVFNKDKCKNSFINEISQISPKKNFLETAIEYDSRSMLNDLNDNYHEEREEKRFEYIQEMNEELEYSKSLIQLNKQTILKGMQELEEKLEMANAVRSAPVSRPSSNFNDFDDGEFEPPINPGSGQFARSIKKQENMHLHHRNVHSTAPLHSESREFDKVEKRGTTKLFERNVYAQEKTSRQNAYENKEECSILDNSKQNSPFARNTKKQEIPTEISERNYGLERGERSYDKNSGTLITDRNRSSEYNSRPSSRTEVDNSSPFSRGRKLQVPNSGSRESMVSSPYSRDIRSNERIPDQSRVSSALFSRGLKEQSVPNRSTSTVQNREYSNERSSRTGGRISSNYSSSSRMSDQSSGRNSEIHRHKNIYSDSSTTANTSAGSDNFTRGTKQQNIRSGISRISDSSDAHLRSDSSSRITSSEKDATSSFQRNTKHQCTASDSSSFKNTRFQQSSNYLNISENNRSYNGNIEHKNDSQKVHYSSSKNNGSEFVQKNENVTNNYFALKNARKTENMNINSYNKSSHSNNTTKRMSQYTKSTNSINHPNVSKSNNDLKENKNVKEEEKKSSPFQRGLKKQ